MSAEKNTLVQRFQTALELYQAGEDMMRQNLRRRYPEAGEKEIEAKLVQWLQTRPGAEQGDCLGPAYVYKTVK